MKRIKYSPEYRKRILELRDYLEEKYGEKTAKKVVKEITDAINLLPCNEKMGMSLRSEYGIDTDYRYIFKAQNYIFYTINKDSVLIVNMYNEKENYIRKLFCKQMICEESLINDY